VNYRVVVENVMEFDRRLGSIVCQAFDDCSGTESAFKVRSLTDLNMYRWLTSGNCVLCHPIASKRQ